MVNKYQLTEKLVALINELSNEIVANQEITPDCAFAEAMLIAILDIHPDDPDWADYIIDTAWMLSADNSDEAHVH